MIAGHEAVSHGDIILGPKNVTDLPPAGRGTAMMFRRYATAVWKKPHAISGRHRGRTFWHVILPVVLPSLIGVGLFGFTLSWDEIARRSQTVCEKNTLPLELPAPTSTVTTPEIYALGTVTTGVSFLVIGLSLTTILFLRSRRERHGSDAGKATV